MIDKKKIVLGLIIGITLVNVYLYTGYRGKHVTEILGDRIEQYSFLNVAKIVDLKKHYIINFVELRTKLNELSKKYKYSSYVYFSYLNNGSWIGINEREGFYAASTVKVPLAMAAYKAIEDGRLALTDVYILQESDLDSNFGALYKKGPGVEISLKEALREMLVNSDNTARNAVYGFFNNIGIEDPLQDVYSNLGWDFLPGIVSGDAQDNTQGYSEISVKVLSNMFIALYNASYVNPDSSNQILAYLSQTPFDTQIDEGIPDIVPVAHKNGVGGSNDTYSDCGIVYAPNRNYILCVGSKKASEEIATEYMVDVSEAVYDFVINN